MSNNRPPIALPLDPITLLSKELRWFLFDFLPRKALRAFGEASKEKIKEIEEYSYKVLPRFYYAVGKPLVLSEYSAPNAMFGNIQYEPRFKQKSLDLFTPDEVMNSIFHPCTTIYLFDNYDAANRFRQFESPKEVDKNSDTPYTLQTSAAYVVSVHNGLFLRDVIYHPPESWLRDKSPKVTIDYLITSKTNLESIHFAQLYNQDNGVVRFFAAPNNNQFTQYFNLNPVHDELVLNAVLQLFNSYKKSWYEFNKIRHCDAQVDVIKNFVENVKAIVIFLYQKHSLDELQQFFNSKRVEATNHPNLNQEAYYCRMLDFAIAALLQVDEQTQLPISVFQFKQQFMEKYNLLDVTIFFLQNMRTKASADANINQEGLYRKMLDFSIDKLSEIFEIRKLNGINDFFNNRRQIL